MRKIFLLPFLLLWAFTLPAQDIYSTSFQDVAPVICIASGTPVIQYLPPGWMIYQTTNGHWDGPIDSTRCISAQQQANGFGVEIDLGQIDPAEALFIRATAEELSLQSMPFAPNKLYNLIACASMGDDPGNDWLIGSGCAQDMCTGVFLGIAIPDSNGNPGGATRFHTNLADADQSNCTISCFPSEYFDDQQLRELILKFSFPPTTDWSGQFLNLSGIYVQLAWEEPGLVTEVLAFPQHFSNGIYTLPIDEADNSPFFQLAFLALHEPFTYPDAQHETYIEGRPVPNTTDPKTINLVVEEYQSLEIQPFTNFRGAKVLGSDSIRHTLHLVNNGGDICMNFLDLIFSGEDEYQHGGGTISMHNGFSCMQFRDQSALRVKKDATLHYGQEGTGLLLLCAGSTIALEENATLYFDGRLVLSECNDHEISQQIYLDLPPGARLVFTEKAHVTNQFSHLQQMILQVRMLGGSLNDSALRPEDRAIIQRIWPVPAPRLADNITLLPNPCATSITLEYLSAREEEITLVWTNLSGQFVGEERVQAQRGPNSWQPALPDAAGMYLLAFRGATESCIKKVIKLEP